MVEVNKVTASFNCNVLKNISNIPNPPTVPQSIIYPNVDPQYTVVRDPFSIIVDRTITTTLVGDVVVTGFLIPYSRRYAISVVVNSQQAYASGNVVLGAEYKTFLCATLTAEVGYTSYTAPTIENSFYTTNAMVMRGSVFGCRNNTVFTDNPLGSYIGAASYTIEADLAAGDFVFFRIFYTLFYPPNANLYLAASPQVYAQIAEITDI